jgi:menaquinone-dependent protoporphyrinogen IX oxidase
LQQPGYFTNNKKAQKTNSEGKQLKALIVYGTRYGATASTSDFIAKTLQEEGYDTRVVNAKKEKVNGISEYDLIIVGSGLQIDKWTSEPEAFLNKFKKEVANKKVAIFVSSGAYSIIEHEGDKKAMDKAQKNCLGNKAAKYSLKPIALGLFGGIWDYNQMGLITRNAMGFYKKRIENAGFKENAPGVYDTRNWDTIKTWTRELVK